MHLLLLLLSGSSLRGCKDPTGEIRTTGVTKPVYTPAVMGEAKGEEVHTLRWRICAKRVRTSGRYRPIVAHAEN